MSHTVDRAGQLWHIPNTRPHAVQMLVVASDRIMGKTYHSVRWYCIVPSYERYMPKTVAEHEFNYSGRWVRLG